MNAAAGRKIAVDVPSGLDADTGRARRRRSSARTSPPRWAARKLGLVRRRRGARRARRGRRPRRPDRAGGRGRPRAAGCSTTPAIAARLPRRAPAPTRAAPGTSWSWRARRARRAPRCWSGRRRCGGRGAGDARLDGAGQAALDAKVVELMTARYPDGDDAAPEAALAGAARRSRRARRRWRSARGSRPARACAAVVRDAGGARCRCRWCSTPTRSTRSAPRRPPCSASAPAPRILTPHPGEMGRLAGHLHRGDPGRSARPRARARGGAARHRRAQGRAHGRRRARRARLREPDG